ncbi:MAG: hypothetical protein ACE5G3_10810, partial [Gammaproteobacteria bacterium]
MPGTDSRSASGAVCRTECRGAKSCREQSRFTARQPMQGFAITYSADRLNPAVDSGIFVIMEVRTILVICADSDTGYRIVQLARRAALNVIAVIHPVTDPGMYQRLGAEVR